MVRSQEPLTFRKSSWICGARVELSASVRKVDGLSEGGCTLEVFEQVFERTALVEVTSTPPPPGWPTRSGGRRSGDGLIVAGGADSFSWGGTGAGD